MKFEFEDRVIEDTEDKLIQTDEGISCGCSNLPNLRFTGHFDMTDCYITTYSCENCGNHITVSVKRSEEDRKLWMPDEEYEEVVEVSECY